MDVTQHNKFQCHFSQEQAKKVDRISIRFMSRNSSTRFIRIDVTKFICVLCPLPKIKWSLPNILTGKPVFLQKTYVSTSRTFLNGQSRRMNFVTSIWIKLVDEFCDINPDKVCGWILQHQSGQSAIMKFATSIRTKCAGEFRDINPNKACWWICWH